MVRTAKSPRIPVLFVLIGWGRLYDGTESITGKMAYLQAHPGDNEEAEAFAQKADGYYYCGAGSGKLHEDLLDVVFVAMDPLDGAHKLVGVYHQAEIYETGKWTTVLTKHARLIPMKHRQPVVAWPAGQGLRRWAHRVLSTGVVHPKLLRFYRAAASSKTRPGQTRELEDLDPELSAFEGKLRPLFLRHRHREARLRAAKIRQALCAGNGHLRCEVPRCGFDFFVAYGKIGRRYAVVHHKRELATLDSKGAQVSLDELAIVCANCHAMIHRGGHCWALDEVKPRRRSG
jgi:hypothetical protein